MKFLAFGRLCTMDSFRHKLMSLCLASRAILGGEGVPESPHPPSLGENSLSASSWLVFLISLDLTMAGERPAPGHSLVTSLA